MNRPAYTNRVREDFDRVAELPEAGSWDRNAHYHPSLLKQLPLRLDETLKVGCGTGTFARLLAERCNRVVAVDLSPRMVEMARARSLELTNIEYLVAY
jgi:ubiquinone/menaquinone biosynthesis C-methylase UbiE